MGPKDTSERVSDMFRQPLIELLNPRHELVRLATVMDWPLIEASFSKHFASRTGAVAEVGGRTAVPAARLRLLRRGRGQHLGREPVLAALHGRAREC